MWPSTDTSAPDPWCTVADDPRLAVFADDGLSFFSSADAFTGYAEPFDALNGIYTAVYDAAGRRFAVTAPPVWRTPRPGSWRARLAWQRALRENFFVDLELDERFPRDEEAAAAAIRDGLRGRHRSEDLDGLSLRELLAMEPPVA